MTCRKCRESLTDSKIKVEEGSRKAVFLNDARAQMHRTRVDGCLVRNRVAADFVVSAVETGDVVVELKGKDVVHAVEQILETASELATCERKRGPFGGLVVCNQYPRIDTKIQKLKAQFAKVYKGPVHVVTKNYEFRLERVLSFAGPF